MAIVITNDKHYTDIANAIREKNGGETKYLPSEMAAAITEISTIEDVELEVGYVTPTGEKFTVYPNGDGFSSVTVAGDANLVPKNIVAGVTIFGVEGSKEDEEPDLSPITVTPTGDDFTEYPDGDGFSSVTVAGDENLIPENIKKDVTIYGVTGTAEGGGAADTEVIPTGYEAYVEAAKTLYTGPYSGLMVMDDCMDYIGVVFLMDDFVIKDYDKGSQWISMQGAVYCQYKYDTDTWAVLDYRAEASTGEHYMNHIVYSTRVLYFENTVLQPTGGNSGGSATMFYTTEPIGVGVRGKAYIQTELPEIFYELQTEE